jgi:hypothetical protein
MVVPRADGTVSARLKALEDAVRLIKLQASISRSAVAPLAATPNSQWFDTSDGNRPNIFDGVDWIAVRDETIAAAQDSADGKNTIYRQPTEPSTGALGDTWFDSDDGNKIYVHDGAAWVASQLGTNAFEDLAVNDAKIGNLDVGKLTTGTLLADIVLSSTIRTANTGARVELGPFGIVTFADDNTPQTVLPSDAGGVNSFKGTIEASGATFTGGVSFRGATEVARGATVTLASGVTAPQQAPTAVVDWATVALPVSTFARHGIGWVYKDAKWWTVTWTGSNAYLVSYDPGTGAEISFIALTGADTYVPGGGLAWSGTYWYTVGQSLTDNNWYVLRWDTSGVLQNGSMYSPVSGTGWFYETYTVGSMQIAYRASTGLLAVVEHDAAGQRFRVQYRDATTCATTSTVNTSVQAGFTAPPGGVAFGSFDYGSERMAVASRNSGSVWVFNPASSYTYSATDSFPAASGMLTGLGWDGTSFTTVRIFPDGASNMQKYTDIGKAWTPTAAESTGWGGNVWYDSNGTGGTHETMVSPQAQFTMKKRARFTVTTPDIPTGSAGTDDPDSTRIYLGFGASGPLARTSLWLQGTGGRSQTFTTIATSGTNPPAAGNFPTSATPGTIQSSDGTALISGSGAGILTSLAVAGSPVRAPTLVRRTTSQSVLNSATLVNDDTLFFNAEASATYLVQAMVFVSQSVNTAAADFKLGLRVPAGASFNAAGPNPDPSITVSVSVGSGIWSALLGSSTGSIPAGIASNVLPQATAVFITAVVNIAGTAGVVGLTWAQNTATAAVTTTVNANSYLRAERF